MGDGSRKEARERPIKDGGGEERRKEGRERKRKTGIGVNK